MLNMVKVPELEVNVEMLPASQKPRLQPALNASFATFFSTLPTSLLQLIAHALFHSLCLDLRS